MNKRSIVFLSLLALIACSAERNYDPSHYYSNEEQQKLLSRIVTYIYTTPPYTSKQDRFKPEHEVYYDSVSKVFALDQLFVNDQGEHFYLIVRPGPHKGEFRGAGGHFNLAEGMHLTGFREDFVTPIYGREEVQEKSRFLFDQLALGKLEPYLRMSSYVQWPNPASSYDTLNYEWTLVLPE